VTALVVLIAVPDVPGSAGAQRAGLRPVLGNRGLLGAAVAIGLSFAAVYVTLTYFAPVVRQLTGTPQTAIPAFLMLFGVAGVAGNALAGTLVDRRLPATLAGALGGVAVAAVLLGTSGGWLPLAVAAIGLWGLCGSAFPTTFQTWALSLAPGQAENAGSLVVVAVNLGIGGGALLGGALLGHGAGALVATTAGLLIAVLLAVQAARLPRRSR
jgi:DHA1 family inner membrane transport protein